MDFWGNIQRIRKMEIYFDTVFNTVHNAPELIGDEHISSMLKSLSEYYENGQWLRDYEADERGEFPKDLKRGVLAQDAMYDLLRDAEKARKLLIPSLDELPKVYYDRYIEIGDIISEDKNDKVKSIEITVGSAIRNKDISRCSVVSVCKEIKRLCKGKKAELIFKSCDEGKWDALDWASSVYLIVCSMIDDDKLETLVIYTKKNAFELFAPRDSRFRTENDKKMFLYLVKIADIRAEIE